MLLALKVQNEHIFKQIYWNYELKQNHRVLELFPIKNIYWNEYRIMTFSIFMLYTVYEHFLNRGYNAVQVLFVGCDMSAWRQRFSYLYMWPITCYCFQSRINVKIIRPNLSYTTETVVTCGIMPLHPAGSLSTLALSLDPGTTTYYIHWHELLKLPFMIHKTVCPNNITKPYLQNIQFLFLIVMCYNWCFGTTATIILKIWPV